VSFLVFCSFVVSYLSTNTVCREYANLAPAKVEPNLAANTLQRPPLPPTTSPTTCTTHPLTHPPTPPPTSPTALPPPQVPMWSRIGRLSRSTFPKLTGGGHVFGGGASPGALGCLAGRLLCDTYLAGERGGGWALRVGG
jgi:hypothetical protein